MLSSSSIWSWSPLRRNLMPLGNGRYLAIFALSVILWGAWVRISHSGDGCGTSWPLCEGQWIPLRQNEGKTWVEYLHRVLSGLFGIWVLIWAWIRWNQTKEKPRVRPWVLATMVFTLIEALIGAVIVKWGLVADNDSRGRVLLMTYHLVNSLLLVLSITKSELHFQNFHSGKPTERFKPSLQNAHKYWLGVIMPALTMIMILFGPITALSNVLFPIVDHASALKEDFDPEAHWLIRLRWVHPLLAIICGLLGTLLLIWRIPMLPENQKNSWRRVMLLWLLTLIAGLLLVLLHSPKLLKIAHLTTLYFLWITGIRAHHELMEPINQVMEIENMKMHKFKNIWPSLNEGGCHANPSIRVRD